MLVEEVRLGRPTSLVMGCFKANGEPFEGFLQVRYTSETLDSEFCIGSFYIMS
jgi:hypothetical protein